MSGYRDMSENSTEDVALLQSGLVLEVQQRCFEKKKTWNLAFLYKSNTDYLL